MLETIKEEKKKLVKEGKLKKSALADSVIYKSDDNKYYEQIGQTVTDISDEIPFSIPDNWAWTRLSGVVNINMGQSPDGNDVFEADEVDNAYEFHQGKISFTDYCCPLKLRHSRMRICTYRCRIYELSLFYCESCPLITFLSYNWVLFDRRILR